MYKSHVEDTWSTHNVILYVEQALLTSTFIKKKKKWKTNKQDFYKILLTTLRHINVLHEEITYIQ